ncbi:hypothetical protein QFZ62_000315 [Clavibacter sp. B3I6]|uniref:hypothetical protein n=1 Tax=Clavibacter sp. B3I6 TaxID=3042268 RepID=UPI00278B1EE8|nr:hypothetical protein [Clavibacter sp. B3I6]MDQ0743007.1 hypothetical protein [Clavibacter sp. B3I6]
MTAASDPQLSVDLSRLAAQHATSTGSFSASEQLMASITAFDDLSRVSTELQGQAVRAAHEAGISWSRIGGLLGISRQAVQQRFDPHYLIQDGLGVNTRMLGPVSRAEEMHHLAEAGGQGWRPVRSAHGEHELERDDQVWEIRRVSVLSPKPMPSTKDGWQAATTRFPDCFYIRIRRTQTA